MLFLKILTSIFILKYLQEYYNKLETLSKLCKVKVTTPVTVLKKWKNSKKICKGEEQKFLEGLVRKLELLTMR
jgi:hypothetical protein